MNHTEEIEAMMLEIPLITIESIIIGIVLFIRTPFGFLVPVLLAYLMYKIIKK